MRRLFEKKEDEVKKQKLLSDKEKAIVIKFFNLHPEQDKKCKEFGIDWNRHDIPFEKFFNLINSFNERFLPKLTMRDLKEGKDYGFIGEDDWYKYYFILSYKGSVTIASNNVEPEVWTTEYGLGYDTAISVEENAKIDYPIKVSEDGTIFKGGAKWCTAYNHTSSNWDSYTTTYESFFIYTCAKKESLKKFQKVAVRISNGQMEEMYNEEDISFNKGDVYNHIRSFIVEHARDVDDLIDKFTDLQEEERRLEEERKEKRKQEIKAYIDSLPRINIDFQGREFPLVKMGERAEGDVYGGRYLIPINVPYSPRFVSNNEFFISTTYEDGCNRWDISIARQWLNSDLPKGQWYKELTPSKNWDIDWTDYYNANIRDFTNSIEGFLKIVGLSKSQLNPVKNITYTTEGEEIITEDYVWIPSLTEMSTQSDFKEGKALAYWSKLLGGVAHTLDNEFRVMKVYDYHGDFVIDNYFTRSASSGYPSYLSQVSRFGYVNDYSSSEWLSFPVLMCPKNR